MSSLGADDSALSLASSAASDTPLHSTSSAAGMCNRDCVLAVSLASSGLVMAAIVVSLFIFYRRRRQHHSLLHRVASGRDSVGIRKEAIMLRKASAGGSIEKGVFRRYMTPQKNSAELDDDGLVDVLDLFDPPAAAHLRSPGPRKLSSSGFRKAATDGGAVESGWGPEWRFLANNSPTPLTPASSRTAASTNGATSRNLSDASDKVGIKTMLDASISSTSSHALGLSVYAHRAPVLVPRNLDAAKPNPLAVTPQPAPLREQQQRPGSMMREKRPPPLKLHAPGTSNARTGTRPSYISVAHATMNYANGNVAAPLAKPALSPITPLLTPPIASHARSQSNGPQRMRVPTLLAGTHAPTGKWVTRSGAIDSMPVELIRRSMDAGAPW